MKNKALVLGAVPPFEGPWVPISEAKAWRASVVSIPARTLGGKVLILVEDHAGHVTPQPNGDPFSGRRARASIPELEGVDSVSVLIEEEEGG